jgi:hypothetical protein
MHLGPVSMLSARTNRVPTCLLTVAELVSQRQCNTSVGRENQLSRYTPKKKSHNVFFEKALAFSHPLQLRFGYFNVSSDLIVSRNRRGLPPFCRSNCGIFLCKLPKSGFMVEVKQMHLMHLVHFMQLWFSVKFQSKAIQRCKPLVLCRSPPCGFYRLGPLLTAIAYNAFYLSMWLVQRRLFRARAGHALPTMPRPFRCVSRRGWAFSSSEVNVFDFFTQIHAPAMWNSGFPKEEPPL